MLLGIAPLRISFGGGGTDLEEYHNTHDGFTISSINCARLALKRSDSAVGSTLYSWLSSSSLMPSLSFEPPGSLTILKSVLNFVSLSETSSIKVVFPDPSIPSNAK